MTSLTQRARSRAATTRGLLTVSAAVVLFTVAACGSSDSEGGGGDGAPAKGDAKAVSAAEARLQPYLDTPSSIPVKTPLTKKPEEGKSLYLIRYNLPIGALLDAPHKAAAEALGWKFKVLPVDPADPLSQSNAVQQAIAGGADYIEVSSGSAQSIGEGLAAARAAGVPVFLQAGDTVPEGEKNWIFGNANNDYVNVLMARLMDYAIVDSKGTANILNLTVPDYPIVAAANKYVEEELPKNCSTCSIQTENLSAPDAGAGKGPDVAVAALRKNPKLNYILLPVESVADGLPQALRAAGLDKKVKLLVLGASKTMPPGLQDGSFAALALQSNDAQPWMAVDMIARYSIGMDVDAKEHSVDPGWIWTKDNAPKGETTFAGPEGYQDQYKKLWQVAP